MLDKNTEKIIDKIFSTSFNNTPDLLAAAQIALIDYLASYLLAVKKPIVQELGKLYHGTGKSEPKGTEFKLSAEYAALFYGFSAHYLDIDDAHPNVQGHPSAVIFSALLAIAEPEDQWHEVLESYIIALELEGLLGKIVNPALKIKGWHASSILGGIAAVTAIGHLRKVTPSEMTKMLSIVATQSMGMAYQFGSDIKPLHAGLAAKNAVFSYQVVMGTGITASQQPFSEDSGWFKTLLGEEVRLEEGLKNWLEPPQLMNPGLWYKRHPFCSAAMTSHDTAELLWNKGVQMAELAEVTIHFSPNQDRALRFSAIQTGTEGKFSVEYIIWQVLRFGKVKHELFETTDVPAEFIRALPKIQRIYDLVPQGKTDRKVMISVLKHSGESITATVEFPKGSPENPLSMTEIIEKVQTDPEKEWLESLYTEDILQNRNLSRFLDLSDRKSYL